jgi:hypothetical protein
MATHAGLPYRLVRSQPCAPLESHVFPKLLAVLVCRPTAQPAVVATASHCSTTRRRAFTAASVLCMRMHRRTRNRLAARASESPRSLPHHLHHLLVGREHLALLPSCACMSRFPWFAIIGRQPTLAQSCTPLVDAQLLVAAVQHALAPSLATLTSDKLRTRHK